MNNKFTINRVLLIFPRKFYDNRTLVGVSSKQLSMYNSYSLRERLSSNLTRDHQFHSGKGYKSQGTRSYLRTVPHVCRIQWTIVDASCPSSLILLTPIIIENIDSLLRDDLFDDRTAAIEQRALKSLVPDDRRPFNGIDASDGSNATNVWHIF